MTSWLQKLGLGLKKSSSALTGGISDIFTKRKVDGATLDELEELLICSDLGVKASETVIARFAKKRLNKDADEKTIRRELADEIATILQPCEAPKLFDFSTETKFPLVCLFAGVNGAGKTTTIGKLAAKFKNRQISLIAGDTFRAAAVEQLSAWGERNNIRVFKGAPNCDAAALCYDGLQEAIRRNDDLVFIDTAGRLQNKTGLMDELRKIIKVMQKVIPEAPHRTLLCLDATTGSNVLDQVKTFKSMVNINGLIVNKLDGTAKGGILVAVAAENPLPVYYIGVGEGIEDLDTFNAADYAANLLGVD